jgi:hypothetical protein
MLLGPVAQVRGVYQIPLEILEGADNRFSGDLRLAAKEIRL